MRYKPFEHVDKRFTAQVYEDLFLLETLFPLTRSCLSEDVIIMKNLAKNVIGVKRSFGHLVNMMQKKLEMQ